MKLLMYLLPWGLLLGCEIRHGQPLLMVEGVWGWVLAGLPFVLLGLFWIYLARTLRKDRPRPRMPLFDSGDPSLSDEVDDHFGGGRP